MTPTWQYDVGLIGAGVWFVTIIHCKNMMVILTQNVVNSVACVVTRLC